MRRHFILSLFCVLAGVLSAADLTFSNGTVGTYQEVRKPGDFQKAAFGWLEVRTATPGACVLRLGEKSDGQGGVDMRPGGTIRAVEVRCHVGKEWTRVPLQPDKRNTQGRNGAAIAVTLPAEVGVILPFRYVQVVEGPKDLEFRRVAVHWPMRRKVKFSHPNRDVMKLWDFCQYSMIATSFAGLMVDGDRERIPYEGDLYINMMGQLYGVDGDPELARRSIRHILKYPTWPLEWRQHAIMCVWEDWHFTQSTDLARETYELLKSDKLLKEGPDGLVHEMRGLLVDWPAGERDGYDMRAEGNTVVNAFHYRNLNEMADLARTLGHREDAAEFRKRAERVKKAINARLFDEKRGLYVDGLGSGHITLHGNAAVLAFGIVPTARKAKVADYLASRPMACSPYFAQYFLEALCQNGKKARALELMIAKDERSWLGMMAQGSTVTMEAWSLKAKPNQDWNHAWGAAPLNILARYFRRNEQ